MRAKNSLVSKSIAIVFEFDGEKIVCCKYLVK